MDSSIIVRGIVAYFPFDGDASDATGNGHHGTVNGAVLTSNVHGVPGQAYWFDGDDDFIESCMSSDQMGQILLRINGHIPNG